MSEARSRLADVVDAARVGGDPIFRTRRGRGVAAVIDADRLVALFDAEEDLTDIRAAAQARAEMSETGEKPIPWAEVESDLGLS